MAVEVAAGGHCNPVKLLYDYHTTIILQLYKSFSNIQIFNVLYFNINMEL